MESRTIKEKMSKGPWEVSDLEAEVVIDSETTYIADCTGTPYEVETEVANAAAIVAAVNGTWNAGIDPEKVGDVVKMLGDISAWLSANTAPSPKQLRDLKGVVDAILNQAKL